MLLQKSSCGSWPRARVHTTFEIVETTVRWGRSSGWAALVLALSMAAPGCATTRGRDLGEVTIREGADHPRGGPMAQLERSRQAIAVIETDVGRGMGFVIDPSGFIITNRHVIEDADHVVSVSFPDLDPPQTYESVQVVYTDPDQDIALLRVTVTEPLPFVPLATRKVLAVGRYLHESDRVSTFRRDGDGPGPGVLVREYGEVERLAVFNPAAGPGAFVGVSSPIQRGQSGGPVLDAVGRAVGIITWIWRDKVGGYAIPIAEATRMLDERPPLVGVEDRMTRARERSQRFLQALGAGDIERARRLTSPSFARKVRGETLAAILGSSDEVAIPVLQGFVAAVESLVDDPAITVEVAYERLRDIVARTGTETFIEELGLDSSFGKSQVISFFFEFGQAYYAARAFGAQEPEAAIDAAMRRLQTIDAARTFALADSLDTLAGNSVEIDSIELVPGAYAPKALVTLRSARNNDAAGEPEMLALHLRMEWGDWYIAAVGRAALSDEEG